MVDRRTSGIGRRSNDSQSHRAPGSVGIELLGTGATDELDAPTVDPPKGLFASVVAAVAAGIVVLLVAAAFVWSGGEELATPPVATPTNTPDAVGEPGPERIEIDPPSPSFDLDTLDSAPEELLQGLTLAWIGEEGLQLRDISSGDDVDLSGSPRIQIPPLPDNSTLVRADNITSAVVPENLGASGLISNTFETVRLADGVSSFGFVEEHDGGSATIHTGTLWGPSIHPILDVSADAQIFIAPGQGIAVSRRDGTGDLVTGGGEARPTPRRWGRVVAVNSDSLAGIHCDAVGVCTGRITRWDGVETAVLDPAVLAADVVRLSPESDVVFAWNLGESVVAGPGVERRWSGGPDVNQSITWDDATNLLLWVVDDQLVVLDPTQDAPVPYVVRSVGEVRLGAGGELSFLRL